MKAKIFEVVLHKLPLGLSPAVALEEQINPFLAQHPDLQVVSTHMNCLLTPAEPHAMPSSSEASLLVLCTLFYTESCKSDSPAIAPPGPPPGPAC